MEILQQKIASLHQKFRALELGEYAESIRQRSYRFLLDVKRIGTAERMDDFEKSKLGIFNQLNFFQFLNGILVPLIGLLHRDHLPFNAWIVACLPACTSLIVLAFNYFRKYDAALFSYFILYPFFTCVVYIHGMNSGIGLHFILYGILSVFFLQDIGYMLFTVALSMVSYFVLTVVLKDFIYQVETEYKLLYLLNQALAILFIFYGLFLIKRENANYQFSILSKKQNLAPKEFRDRKTGRRNCR